MKHAKNLSIGSLVQVPVCEFQPYRSGYNGWLFSAGIIRCLGRSKKTGTPLYEVEYCSRRYDHDRKTFVKWFRKDQLFEKDFTHAKMLLEYPREHYCQKRYDADTEFMIDQGLIPDYQGGTQNEQAI